GQEDRRHGRDLLRRRGAAQPARADLAGGLPAARRLHPQLPPAGADDPGRGLPERAVPTGRGLHPAADAPRPGDRAGRGGSGRQARSRLEEPPGLARRRLGGGLVIAKALRRELEGVLSLLVLASLAGPLMADPADSVVSVIGWNSLAMWSGSGFVVGDGTW